MSQVQPAPIETRPGVRLNWLVEYGLDSGNVVVEARHDTSGGGDGTKRKLSFIQKPQVMGTIMVVQLALNMALCTALCCVVYKLLQHNHAASLREEALENDTISVCERHLAALKDEILQRNRVIFLMEEDSLAMEQTILKQNQTIRNLTSELASSAKKLDFMLGIMDSSNAEECTAKHDNSIFADGVCYFYLQETLNWEDARDRCTSLGASLAAPRTENQWRAVYNLTRSRTMDRIAWIGFRQSPADGPLRDMAGNDVTQNLEERLLRDDSGADCAQTTLVRCQQLRVIYRMIQFFRS